LGRFAIYGRPSRGKRRWTALRARLRSTTYTLLSPRRRSFMRTDAQPGPGGSHDWLYLGPNRWAGAPRADAPQHAAIPRSAARRAERRNRRHRRPTATAGGSRQPLHGERVWHSRRNDSARRPPPWAGG